MMSDLLQITKKEPEFPVTLSESALQKMLQVRKDDEIGKEFKVRVACKGGGCSGLLYSLDFDDRSFDGDFIKTYQIDEEELDVVVDPHSAQYLKGLTVEYIRSGFTEGFKFIGGDNVRRTCGCGASFSV